MMYVNAARSYTYDPRIDTPNRAIVRDLPQPFIEDLIHRTGGLPKQNIRLSERDFAPPTGIRYYPLQRYTITQVRVQANEPLWLAAFTEQPTYQYIMTLVVEYADRDIRTISVRVERAGLFTGFSIRRSLLREK